MEWKCLTFTGPGILVLSYCHRVSSKVTCLSFILSILLHSPEKQTSQAYHITKRYLTCSLESLSSISIFLYYYHDQLLICLPGVARHLKKEARSRAWWHMFVIPVLGKWRQVDHTGSKPASATQLLSKALSD